MPRRRRPPRHWGLMLVAGGLLALGSGRLPAAEEEVYPMVFPLLGDHTLTDSFGDPRGRGRRHEGIDVLAERMVPVVAVADGTVRWLHDRRGGNCCDVAILHDDGWRSRYIHLNNDTPGSDDGRAVGIAPGIEKGARVSAGQLIGWVGDSGNAESTVPHLHFELRRPDGTPVDPLPSLKAALVRGRSLVPEALGQEETGREEAEAPRGGLWRRLMGRGRSDDDRVGPTPPMPADEGELQAPPDDPWEVPPLAEGELPGLDMDRRVEEVPVEEPPERGGEEAERRRPSLLSCFGFAGGDDDDEPEPDPERDPEAAPDPDPS